MRDDEAGRNVAVDEGRHDVKKLVAWQKSFELARLVCKVCTRFPAEYRFGLADQMRRASSSIPANLAEGYGRGTANERRQFVRIARGSAFELETYLLLAGSLDLLDDPDLERLLALLDEVKRLVGGLHHSLR